MLLAWWSSRPGFAAFISMNDLFTAAVELQQFCDERQWRFCFIGGVAVQRWGEPRFTADADMTLLTGFGDELPFVSDLLAHFTPRRTDAREFALKNRVLLLRATNQIPLDVDGILARQWGKLDLDLVRGELTPLLQLQERPESMTRLEQKIRAQNRPFITLPPPAQPS